MAKSAKMVKEEMIQVIAKAFVDRYALEQYNTRPTNDKYLDIAAIAVATAEAALKACQLHTRASRILQKQVPQ